jgi:hypothetical protein
MSKHDDLFRIYVVQVAEDIVCFTVGCKLMVEISVITARTFAVADSRFLHTYHRVTGLKNKIFKHSCYAVLSPDSYRGRFFYRVTTHPAYKEYSRNLSLCTFRSCYNHLNVITIRRLDGSVFRDNTGK